MNRKQIVSLLFIMALLIGLFPSNICSASVKKVHLNKKSISMVVKKSYRLKLKNAKAKKVKWKSSNKKIVTVKKGVLKAKKKGKCTIIAKYSGKKYKCTVWVNDRKETVATPKPTQNANSGTGEKSTGVKFAVEKYDKETMLITVSLENNTNDMLNMGRELSLEKYDNGSWSYVSQKVSQIPADAMIVDANSKVTWDISLSYYFTELPSGQYRISKQISPYGKVVAEFTIP